MATDRQNLQDAFLNTLRKSHGSVTIFLVSGVKLTGYLTSFDNYCVMLKRDNHSQLVYKHSISTIVPTEPISLYPSDTSNQQEDLRESSE